MTTPDCVFCAIVRHEAPAKIIREWDAAIAFIPLDPVVNGHVLVVPRRHVQDAAESKTATLAAMSCAVELARETAASNIITSIGKAATQSVFHLHIHVIPRYAGDDLMVPWGTTGDPHEPHWCAVADDLAEQLVAIQGGDA